MTGREFEAGLSRHLPALRKKLAYIEEKYQRKETNVYLRREREALAWVVELLEDAEAKLGGREHQAPKAGA